MAKAQIIFTEIMYDLSGTDTGREWIEITNTGETSENIEDYKLFESGTNHNLTFVSGEKTLTKNKSAVIVSDPDKFKVDWPNFSGIIFDSSFSLSNTGETLILRTKDLVDVDNITYTGENGAAGDGNSLGRTGLNFVAQSPNPGEYLGGGLDQSPPDNSSNDNTVEVINIDNNISTHSSPESASFVKEVIDIELITPRDRVALAGMPLLFETQAVNAKNNSKYLDGTSYDWTLGDGGAQSGKRISYAYVEPGEYVVIVKAKFKESVAVSRCKIKILPFSIKISDVKKGEYIELENDLSNEANIGGALISNGEVSFRIPEDTIILPRKKIKIPSSVLNIDLSNQDIRLKDSTGKDIYIYEKEKIGQVLGVSTTTKEGPVTLQKTENTQTVKAETKKNVRPKKKADSKKKDDKKIDLGLQDERENTNGTSTLGAQQHFEPIVVISKPNDGFWNKTLRFLGNLF